MGKLTRKFVRAAASRPILTAAIAVVGLSSSFGLIGGSLFSGDSSSDSIRIVSDKLAEPSLTSASLAATATKTLHNIKIPESQALYLTEVVGVGTDELAAQIFEKGQGTKPIYLLINSPGGSVLSGAMIISAMESSKVPIYTVCLEVCASMAAMIFEHGTERYVVDRALLMFHPASIGGGGHEELDKVVSRLLTLQKYIGKMESHVATRAGISFERYKSLSSSELWIDGEDAVNNKFADKLISLPVVGKNKVKRPNSSDSMSKKISIIW